MPPRSRISSKFRTVIPKEVRDRLKLKTGDVLQFYLTDKGCVTIEKAPEDDDDRFASFREWRSDDDDRLYRDL